VLTLQVGDELEVKGPIPKFEYKSNMKKNIGEWLDIRPYRSYMGATGMFGFCIELTSDGG
jgi:hypothetical protein